MSNVTEMLLMVHVGFGMLCIVAGVWVFVDSLHANANNQTRIRTISFAVAAFMWLSYLFGGYWYVFYYGPEKAMILKGPWAFSHNFFMEMKEHVVLMLLLLATYLPIAASNNLGSSRAARNVVLWISGLIVLVGMAMDGSGAIISMGVKVGLLPK